jgi:UDP-N-acetylmuramoylalanine--D-glutamate ligase
LSSYQLDLTEHLACSVAVILNVSPDHLERHGGMAGYARAKRRILRNQGPQDWAIIGVDDEHGADLVRRLRARGGRKVVPIAVGRAVEGGIHVIDGKLIDALDGAGREVLDLTPIESLQGTHNWQNASAAYGVARALGVLPEVAATGMTGFPGLAHRMEPVATIDGVRFVNDSKATNADATARALSTYDNIHWIAGGRAKDGGLGPVLPWLERVRRAYLIGEATDAFATILDQRVMIRRCGDLAEAVREAAAEARREAGATPVVLLSPACASFDQFANFEARGDAFKALVAALAAVDALPLRERHA